MVGAWPSTTPDSSKTHSSRPHPDVSSRAPATASTLAVDYLGIGRGTGARYEDGVRLAELGSNWFKRVYWDGEAGDPFEALVPLARDGTLIRFSPDRRHVTYVGLEGAGSQVRIGVDGSVGPAFSDFSLEAPPDLQSDRRGASRTRPRSRASGEWSSITFRFSSSFR